MTSTGKVAKKQALYPPKKMMRELHFEEGQPVKYKIEDSKLVVEAVKNPLDLAISGRKWAKTSVEEFERESEREQEDLYG